MQTDFSASPSQTYLASTSWVTAASGSGAHARTFHNTCVCGRGESDAKRRWFANPAERRLELAAVVWIVMAASPTQKDYTEVRNKRSDKSGGRG